MNDLNKKKSSNFFTNIVITPRGKIINKILIYTTDNSRAIYVIQMSKLNFEKYLGKKHYKNKRLKEKLNAPMDKIIN